MVEFALVAPFLLLFLIGLLVLGIAIANQVQLSNAVRDGARAAAICGGAGTAGAQSGATPSTTTTKLPNGQDCTTANLVRYVNTSLALIPDASPQIAVVVNGLTSTDLANCQPGGTVQVTASFKQPLYLPLVGYLLGDQGNPNYRSLSAKAEATCEQ